MFCVECGKEGEIFKDGLCVECYLKNHEFTEGPDFLDIPICVHCGSFKYKNSWTGETFENVVKRYVKNFFKISKELQKVDVHTECKEEKERINCQVFISGFLGDVEVEEKHQVYIRLKKTVCDVCSKRFAGYHEAIIQIRAKKRKLKVGEIDSIVTLVENMVENLQSRGNRNVFIADMGEKHGGINFYISDKGAALSIVKKIQTEYGGEITKSSSNIGMRDGKQIYRMTYSLRIPVFKKNDVIEVNNSYFFINSISKNKAHVFNLSTWKDQFLDVNDLKKTDIKGGNELVKEMILVSQKKDEIQLMNQDNYKIITVTKPKPIDFKTDKVKTIRVNNQLFLYPIT